MAKLKWRCWIALAAAATASSQSWAAEPIHIDLTYDSIMNMVRPEDIPDIKVHHNLHITIAKGDILSERRNRNTGPYADKNVTAQVLENSNEGSGGVSWRMTADRTLVREQTFPQSTRTMTVTLLPGGTCRFDVVDRLKSGFTEYEFLRLKVHEMAFYSSYAIVATSCRVR